MPTRVLRRAGGNLKAKPLRRGEHYVGFAWVLRVMFRTLDASVRNTAYVALIDGGNSIF
jgi:hypothetical protein